MANEVRRGKKRRRASGVPMVLVIILLVLAFGMGGLLGHVVARRSSTLNADLQRANARIIELENTLTLIGFSVDEDDPESWVFDDSGNTGSAADLAGDYTAGGDQQEGDLWAEDGLLSGMLEEDGEPVVVAEFDGGQLLSTEVIPEYNDQLTTQVFDGYNADEVSESVLQTVLTYMASEKIVMLKAQELGLDQLTDEDLKEIDAEAEGIYQEQVTYYMAFVAEPGMSQDEIRTAAMAYMAKDQGGITKESIVEDLKKTWPVHKFYNYTVKDITVTEDEIKAHYDEELAEQKEVFARSPEEFEYAHVNGDTVLYNLDGYHAVRDLLIAFDTPEDADKAADLLDQLDQIDAQKDPDRYGAVQAQLDELYAPLEQKAQEVVAKYQAGEDFLALADAYGSDDAMRTEPVRSQGYYLSDESFLYSTEFVQGSMMLSEPGQLSTPLRSPSGVHLVQYVNAVPAGEVPLADVRDAMEAAALEQKRDAYYQSETEKMLEAANVRYYPERLQ